VPVFLKNFHAAIVSSPANILLCRYPAILISGRRDSIFYPYSARCGASYGRAGRGAIAKAAAIRFQVLEKKRPIFPRLGKVAATNL
jgi:hypothetical protein